MALNFRFCFLTIIGLICVSKVAADCGSCTDYGNCIETTENATCAQCICPNGFSGDCCEVDAPSACSSNPCGISGTQYFVCTNFPHGLYSCTCQPGWTGTNCDTSFNVCNPNPCYNGCGCNTGSGGTFTCGNSYSSYSGQYCETYKYCNSGSKCGCNGANPCLNGGTCIEKKDNYKYGCKCPYGYSGTKCENAICGSYPCEHGGTCIVNSSGNAECMCLSIWSGDHCTIFDACGSITCENGGTCVDNGDGTGTCNCPVGTTGTYCEVVGDNCDPNPCWYPLEDDNVTVTCNNYVGGYWCDCPAGTTGTDCHTNIDECTDSGENVCTSVDGNATCADGLNSFTCTCTEFYTGTNCENTIDFCDSEPCWYPLNGDNVTATCNAFIGGYTCDCPPGTTGEDCHINPDDCVEDGISICNTIDLNATCTDGLDSFTCTCDTEYTGITCEEIRNFCDPNPCWYPLNGVNVAVECISFFGGYECDCPPGTTGTDCHTNIDDCTVGVQNPCKKNDTNAVCTDGLDSFTCACTRNYTGTTCEEMTNFCIPTPCWFPLYGDLYEAQCNPILGDYVCDCPAGTTGKNCSINTDDCTVNGQNVCKTVDNKATCVDELEKYRCDCGPDYTGPNCTMSMIVWNVISLFGGSDAFIALMEDIVDQPALIKSIMPFLLGQMSRENQSSMSWNYDDLFLWASYEKTELTSANIVKWFDTTLGNCFTFNHQDSQTTFKLREAGAQGGFRALMRVRQDEYLAWYDTAALLVFVHTSDTTVFSESLRYQIAPGTSGTVITNKITYSRLNGRYGTCVKDISEVKNYYYTGNYTTDGCLSACYQDAVQESCGCMDPRYAIPEDRDACSVDSWSCVNNVSIVKGDPSNWESCFCPAPCYESQYVSDWTTSTFVTTDVYCDSIKDIVSPEEYNYCMLNYTDMAYINVYVPRLSQQVFRESPAMSLNQLVSYTGGMAGMCIGFSIVTFVDFALLFFLLGRSICFEPQRLYGIE